jgi:hypothetical protein
MTNDELRNSFHFILKKAERSDIPNSSIYNRHSSISVTSLIPIGLSAGGITVLRGSSKLPRLPLSRFPPKE